MWTKSRLTLTQLTKQQRNLKDEQILKITFKILHNTIHYLSYFPLGSRLFMMLHMPLILASSC